MLSVIVRVKMCQSGEKFLKSLNCVALNTRVDIDVFFLTTSDVVNVSSS